MSPSPPFPPPLPFSLSSSSHPGIIGENRASSIQHHLQQQQAVEPPNGEFLLHLLQAGSQVQQHQHQDNNGGNEGGGRGGAGYEQQLLHSSHYSFSLPGIVSGGRDFSFAAWDPAVAALGPSYSYSLNGMVRGAVLGDGRDLPPGLFPSSQFHNVSMGSGWAPPHQQLPPSNLQQQHHFASHGFPPGSSPSSLSSPISPTFSAQVDLRLLQGRSGPGHSLVPIPGGVSSSSLCGSHVETPQRRSTEWHGVPAVAAAVQHHQQQEQLQSILSESGLPPSNSPARGFAGERGGPHQQFFGDGAELMKLLQISSSTGGGVGGAGMDSLKKTADRQQSGVFVGVGGGNVVSGSVVQKALSPAIIHGPIGPPKRNDSNTSNSFSHANDLLGRFWPAPSAPSPVVNGSQDLGTKLSGLMLKEGQTELVLPDEQRCWWGGNPQHVGDIKFDLSAPGGESVSLAPFGSRDGQRFGLATRLYALRKGGGLPETLEYYDGRGLLGGWAGDFLEEVGALSGGGQLQYRKSRGTGGLPREDIYIKAVEQQTGPLNSNHHELQQQGQGPSSQDFECEYSRESNGREEVIRGGVGSRRGSASRLEIGGRRGGRTVIGHWVAVHERQRERDGSDNSSGPNEAGGGEIGSEKGSNSICNVCKDESISFTGKEASGSQKVRDDLKRRRGGQQQEWRMKTQPSHSPIETQPQFCGSKMAIFASGPESSGVINGDYRISSPLKIRPLAAQVDHPGLPSNVVQELPAIPVSAMDESKKIYHDRAADLANGRNDGNEDGLGKEEEEELADAFAVYLDLVDEPKMGDRQVLSHAPTPEDVEYEIRQEQHFRESRRHTHRTLATPSLKPEMRYRPDLEKFTAQMLAMYSSLIPTEEEEAKRRQFLSHLDLLVARDWPGALLFLFGSCANAFGVCNSDIDVCLSINDDQLSKADLILKMAAILRSNNMQNVQALTHARVPIVKFTDPTTGISCDICVNNMLAVVNSKLLHDYSLIDVRLRQLAFLVKHWAKRRQVNETYRGTLSSYAYVLMCIHFLQQRKPAILPCLQEMRPTYRVSVGHIDCAYYDQVETLQNFGTANKETLGELLTSFFEYWAFRHDYNRAVISVRTGGYLSKDEKEWTRRIGNERHLICIEDPLETVHDLGRVVDRHSIRVLRDEFHRAAKILRHDLNPCTTLFEPFIREKP